jgi:hypothetical protein
VGILPTPEYPFNPTPQELQNNDSLAIGPILNDARHRWIGKYLWVNFRARIGLPIFSRVKVLNVDTNSSKVGHSFSSTDPYTFILSTDQGMTYWAICTLQLNDSSNIFRKNDFAFGKVFIEEPPSQAWKTVPDSSLSAEGIVWDEDSAAFSQTLRIKGPHFSTESQNDSVTIISIEGKGLYGMPLNSGYAAFYYGRLSSVFFPIDDSLNESIARMALHAIFGNPTEDVACREGSFQVRTESWDYYVPGKSIHSIVLRSFKQLSVDVPNSIFHRHPIASLSFGYFGDAPHSPSRSNGW